MNVLWPELGKKNMHEEGIQKDRGYSCCGMVVVMCFYMKWDYCECKIWYLWFCFRAIFLCFTCSAIKHKSSSPTLLQEEKKEKPYLSTYQGNFCFNLKLLLAFKCEVSKWLLRGNQATTTKKNDSVQGLSADSSLHTFPFVISIGFLSVSGWK